MTGTVTAPGDRARRRWIVDEQKRLLRETTLAARRSLEPEERALASARIAERVLSRPDVLMADVVMLYAPTPTEVDTTAIDSGLRQRGVEVCYPRVSGPHLDVVAVETLDDLEAGHRGIREPGGPTFEDEVDVVIVPGVAFDLRGGRLGHGGGHYDRLLAELPTASRIGVAFSCQLVLRVPMEDHDQPLDMVVTEHGTHPTGARQGPMEA